MRPTRAFTLIELLVVVAIIAALLAILLPSLGKARQHAAGVACLSNQRQLAVMSTAWANDHQLYPPPATFYNKLEKYGARWGSEAFVCPAAEGYDPLRQHLVGAVMRYYFVIGINQNLVMSTDGPGGPYRGTEWESGPSGGAWGPTDIFFTTRGNTKMTSVKHPASFIFFADTRQDQNGFVAGYWYNALDARRHLGRAMMAWMDGRASFEPDDYVYTLIPRLAGGGIPYFRTGS
jgi:prepilin-type N-terminal cleavage/methylation domain-containing protein/prepilin-type processing-associated H-X9-DG protein